MVKQKLIYSQTLIQCVYVMIAVCGSLSNLVVMQSTV